MGTEARVGITGGFGPQDWGQRHLVGDIVNSLPLRSSDTLSPPSGLFCPYLVLRSVYYCPSELGFTTGTELIDHIEGIYYISLWDAVGIAQQWLSPNRKLKKYGKFLVHETACFSWSWVYFRIVNLISMNSRTDDLATRARACTQNTKPSLFHVLFFWAIACVAACW